MIGNRFIIETIWKMNSDAGTVQSRDAGTVQNGDSGTVKNKKGLTPYELSRRQLLQNSNEVCPNASKNYFLLILLNSCVAIKY